VAVIIVVYGLVGYLCTCGAPVGKPLSRPRQAVLKAWGIGSARVGLFILGYYYIPVRGKRDVSVAPYGHLRSPPLTNPINPAAFPHNYCQPPLVHGHSCFHGVLLSSICC